MVRKRTRTLWADIHTMTRGFALLSFAQRRERIAAECCQLARDVAYYNVLHPDAEPLVIDFDLRADVEAEGGAP
jgi:hypothetical protein